MFNTPTWSSYYILVFFTSSQILSEFPSDCCGSKYSIDKRAFFQKIKLKIEPGRWE